MREPDDCIKVLLVDDHKLVREGICHILENQPELAVIGEAETGRSAIEMTLLLTPDVVVMDISLPDLNGIEATREIVARCPATRVIVLSVHTDQQYIIEGIKAGAKGYLQKNCSAQEFVKAISCVAAGGTYFGPQTCEELMREYLHTQEGGDEFSPLTSREKEVLKLIAQGRNSKEIAFALDISVKTVEFHRQQMMKKLKLYSLPELTRYAVREGITPL